MPRSLVVYSNDHYDVIINDRRDGYILKNKRTDVVEGVGEVLSSTIGKVDVWSDLMNQIYKEKGWNE